MLKSIKMTIAGLLVSVIAACASPPKNSPELGGLSFSNLNEADQRNAESIQPQTRLLLQQRLKDIWLQGARKCVPAAGDGFEQFPSKMVIENPIGGTAPYKCDDGDAVLFGGLLCSVDILEGCDVVRLSAGPVKELVPNRPSIYSKVNQWWRSPRRVDEPDPNRPGQDFTELSPDMGMGIQIYALHRVLKFNDLNAKQQFQYWLNWVDSSAPCLVEIGSACVQWGWPRFCTRDRNERGCTMRPGDLALLNETLDAFRRNGTSIAINPDSRSLLKIALSTSYRRHSELTFLNANLNETGYSLHLVGLDVYLRKYIMRNPDPFIDLAASKLAERQPQNPFFEYLNNGATERAASLVLKRCPAALPPMGHSFYQWMWERSDSSKPDKDTMYWDCAFMGALLLE